MGASQYFESAPTVPSSPSEVRLDLADLSLTLTTDRGVFSHGGIDAGTRLLLQEAPSPAAATTALDLGCGYGPIACTLALRAPSATVLAVDVNERARSLCEANARANGLTNVVVASPDGAPADTMFDVIWSNPPIRVGKTALHDLLLTWLPRLADGGYAVLVVQKHLGADSLATWLGTVGYDATRLCSRQGYRLLRVERAVST